MASAAALRWVQVVQEDAGANPNAAADGIDAANNRATAAAAAHAAAKIQRQLLVRLRVVIMADSTMMGAMVLTGGIGRYSLLELQNETQARFNDVLNLWCVAKLAHIFMRIWIRTKPRTPRVESSKPPVNHLDHLLQGIIQPTGPMRCRS